MRNLQSFSPGASHRALANETPSATNVVVLWWVTWCEPNIHAGELDAELKKLLR